MAEQIQKQKQKQSSKQEHTEDEAPADQRNAELDQSTGDLLADIDEALGDLTDEEVQDFVSSYIQKGGQ